MRIVIRPWQKGDLESIRRITWQSWISTYSSFIPESDLKSYFNIHYTEASLLGMFDDPSTAGLIAERDGQDVGYARLFFNGNENRLYIRSMYLLPGFERQGIGRQLLNTAEGYAVEKGVDRLWLGVMVKNIKALAFYRKAGFQFVREEPFTMGKTTVSHLIGYKRTGQGTFLNRKTYATFDGQEGLRSLSELSLKLLSEQKKRWKDLREGYESLREVRDRDVFCREFSVRLQYNPRRIKSSLAEVAGKNRNEEECFLCPGHLPGSQKGILYRGEYMILCNPVPVLSSHFTVSHLDHRHQAIAEHISTFLRVAADFGSGWMVLYNGPKCGASAPDHLHFQAAPSGQMPIEEQTREQKKLALVTRVDGVRLYRMRGLGREVFILDGDDPRAVGDVFKRYLGAQKEVLGTEEEPMVNIVGFHEEKRPRLIIFPRRKHRPDAFFSEGDARMVISPGVIDMGGILITPVERDFERLDGATVEAIYAEVSLEEEIVDRTIEAIKKGLA